MLYIYMDQKGSRCKALYRLDVVVGTQELNLLAELTLKTPSVTHGEL